MVFIAAVEKKKPKSSKTLTKNDKNIVPNSFLAADWHGGEKCFSRSDSLAWSARPQNATARNSFAKNVVVAKQRHNYCPNFPRHSSWCAFLVEDQHGGHGGELRELDASDVRVRLDADLVGFQCREPEN